MSLFTSNQDWQHVWRRTERSDSTSGSGGKSATSESRLDSTYVDGVFAEVAGRYDLMNDLMSLGIHRLWKHHFVGSLPLFASQEAKILDVAAGTGDIALRLLRRFRKAQVTLADPSSAMLEKARLRLRGRYESRASVVCARAEDLPCDEASFDALTMAFGLRNLSDRKKACAEIHRVLKPGGTCLILEFSPAVAPGIDSVYRAYSESVLPRLGRMVIGTSEPYAYLVESIRRFIPPERVAAELTSAGLERCTHRRLSGGIAFIHKAWKPLV